MTLKAKFVFARLGGIALLKCEPDFGGGSARFDASLVFVGDRLIEECLCLNSDFVVVDR